MVFDAAAVHAALTSRHHVPPPEADPLLALLVVAFFAYVAVILWRAK